MNKAAERKKIILRTSIGGILANVLLGVFKIVFGFLASSPAVITDAVSNFTDALASVVIVTGTAYAGKRPDRKHPYGYGRFEYMVTLVIALIVLYAGVEAVRETIEVIREPHAVHYTAVTLTVVIVSIIVKVIYGCYTRKRAEKAGSKSLHASGSEAIHHALISLFTLAAALIYLLAGVRLEALASGVIAVFIIIEGIHLLRESLSEILGQKAGDDLRDRIRKTITEIEGVSGAYDLHLHDYGPDRMIGSVHVEVPDTWTADRIDRVQRQITRRVLEDEGILLTGIGLYSVNTNHDKAAEVRDEIGKLVEAHDGAVGMHGFYLDPASSYASLDIVISLDVKDGSTLFHQICEEIREKYPQYDFHINHDIAV